MGRSPRETRLRARATLSVILPAAIPQFSGAIQYDRTVAHPERLPRSTAGGGTPPAAPKKKLSAGAWEEARALVWKHRRRLLLGLVLMVISRVSGLVLPYTTKRLMDDVVLKQNWGGGYTGKGCVGTWGGPNGFWLWVMEHPGFGMWLRTDGPRPKKFWTFIMPANTCGNWAVLSTQRTKPGNGRRAVCMNCDTVSRTNSWPRPRP